MLLAFLIWSVCSVLFLIIGIRARSSQKPVGFFTFDENIEVKDVKGYNRAVSLLWIIAAAVFEVLGIPFLFLKQNSPLFVLVILGAVAWSIGIVIAYLTIERKYS